MAAGIQLAPLLTQIKVDIKDFKSQMDKAVAAGVGKAKEISNNLSNVSKIGDKLSKVGGTLTKSVTVPVLGIATASTKMAIDFEDSAAKVSTIADTTKVSMDKLKEGVLKLSNDTGQGASELNEALYQSISAGVDTSHAVEFLGTAVKAAKGGFTDTTTAVDGLSTVLNSYGMASTDAEKIANQMLITQNKGKTTFGELASAVGKVTPVAASLGITTDELFSSLATTTAQGLATSESVTALKAAMSNVINPSKEASDAANQLGIDFSVSALKSKGWMGFLKDIKEKLKEAAPEYANLSNQVDKNIIKMNELEKSGQKGSQKYKDLSKQTKDLEKDMKALAGANDSTVGGFATMFGSVEGLNSMLMLTSDNGMKTYNDTMGQMKSNTTALNDAASKMDASPAEKMKKAFNELKNTGIDVGEKLIPTVERVTQKVAGLADGFTHLSSGQQDFIIGTAGTLAVLGPVLNGLGSFLTVTTKVLPVVKGIGTAVGLLGEGGALTGLAGTLGTAALEFTPWIAGAGAVAFAGYEIYKAISSASDATKEATDNSEIFADITTTSFTNVGTTVGEQKDDIVNSTTKISDATKDALNNYLNLDKKATESLNDLAFNQKTMTAELATDINSKFKAMNDDFAQQMDKRYTDDYNSLDGFLNQTKDLTQDERQRALTDLKNHNEEEKGEEETLYNRIKEITNKASAEHRELTKSEYDEIGQLQENMRNKTVQTLSESQVEAQAILERTKDRSVATTDEQARGMLENANKAKEGTVKEAEETYVKSVNKIKQMRAEGKIESDELAEKMIDAARRQKDGVVASANDLQQETIKKITSANKDILNNTDVNTGKTIGLWDKMKNWWNGWTPASKNATVTTTYLTIRKDLDDVRAQGGSVRSARNMFGYYNGLNYVPTDGYIARLHKGERVLTADQNKAYTQGNIDNKNGPQTTINFNGNYNFANTGDIDYFMNQAALKLKGAR